MGRAWTFGQKVAAGFAAVVLLIVVTAVVAVYALAAIRDGKDHVIAVDGSNVALAGQLNTDAEVGSGAFRGYLLAREQTSLANMSDARDRFADDLRQLRAQVAGAEDRRMLDEIERLAAAYRQAVDGILQRNPDATLMQEAGRQFQAEALPRMRELRAQINLFVDRAHDALDRDSRAATEAADRARNLLLAVAAAAVLLAIVLAVVMPRNLGRQIGTAVQHVRSSSTELQTAANQQAAAATEQATSMNEITTTLSELLTTSKQIAESAQRVAAIASETAAAAGSGDQTVDGASASMAAIKRQVDLIVTHMLELGRKSQQIGGVLDIINELADQTNILAINATIEAAGAGESGKRFAVVADEIRKLADRVGASTKEIRGLIEEVRGAVNTTVMTTEGGTKAVDAGARQFAGVAIALKQIVGSVASTTDAAREIEISTRQQATAVEQVNIAIANVAQATRETEASANQTLQTASELATLSRDLSRIISPEAGAGA